MEKEKVLETLLQLQWISLIHPSYNCIKKKTNPTQEPSPNSIELDWVRVEVLYCCRREELL